MDVCEMFYTSNPSEDKYFVTMDNLHKVSFF